MYIRKLLLALALLAAAPATLGGGGPGLGQPLDERTKFPPTHVT